MRSPRPRRKPGPLKEHYLRVLAETAEAMRLYNLTHGSGCKSRLNAQKRKHTRVE
jgi:hypothetical protein